MSNFIAKINDYGEINNNDKLAINDNPIDLSSPNISLRKLYDDLDDSINKKTPMFIWSKKRNIEKIMLDNETLLHLRAKINYLRGLSAEFMEFQAETIFSVENIRNMVRDKRMTASHYFEDKELQHLINRLSFEAQADAIRLSGVELRLNLERKREEIDSIRADNERRRAETDSINTQNELKRLVMSNIDFNNFPPNLIADVLLSLNGLSAGLISELQFKDRYNDIFFNMEELKKKKAEAELNDFINSSDFKKWKHDLSKRDAEL